VPHPADGPPENSVKVVLASAILLTVATASGAAEADDKTVCLDASTQGQTLRNAHQLVEAREQLRICARRECPGPVRRDCGEWLDGVERSLPTVVFSAKDATSGADLLDVTVTVDGTALARKLDGEAVPMNPGPHTFRFDLADGRTATQQVLVREGEKARAIAVVLAAPPITSPAPATPAPTTPATVTPGTSPAPPSPEPPPSGTPPSTPKRVGAVISGVVGVAGVVTGIVLLVQSSSLVGQRNKLCPDQNACNNQTAFDLDASARNDQTFGFVGLGVGVVGLGAATWLFLTSGGNDTKPATSWQVAPMVGRDGAGLRFGSSW
jgi:hypothetical protein